MTLPVQTPFIIYTADGLAVDYAYSFRLLEASDLRVTFNGIPQASGFTVSGIDNLTGGTVTFAVAPVAGTEIILYRQVSREQLVDYQPFDAFPAETHERALDKLTMAVQEDGNLTLRAVRALPQDVVRDLLLPPAVTRANGILAFDALGNVIVVASIGGTIVHGQLQGLLLDDHPQYHNDARGDLLYLKLTGGVLSGALILPAGPIVLPNQAATKAYVDTNVASFILLTFQSDATGDAQLTVQAAWNAQANAQGYTRAADEVILYRWPSTLQNLYRYIGPQLSPPWTTVQADWLQTTGIAEAPADGGLYGRQNLGWSLVPVSVSEAPITGLYYLRRNSAWFDSAPVIDARALPVADARIAVHVALADPHAQYLLESAATATYIPFSQKGAASGVATLDSATKVPLAQLYLAVANGIATLDSAIKVPLTQLYAGVANGLATLDAGGKILDSQINATIARVTDVTTSMNNHLATADPHTQYQRETEKGAANGYASLDGTGKVPLAQLPATSAAPGRLVQSIAHNRTDSPTGSVAWIADDTIPQITEGNEFFTVTITPQQINSRIKIQANLNIANNLAQGLNIFAAIFRVGSTDALACGAQSVHLDGLVASIYIDFEYPAGLGVLTPVTFTVRAGITPGASVRLNGRAGSRLFGGTMNSFLKVEEYSA